MDLKSVCWISKLSQKLVIVLGVMYEITIFLNPIPNRKIVKQSIQSEINSKPYFSNQKAVFQIGNLSSHGLVTVSDLSDLIRQFGLVVIPDLSSKSHKDLDFVGIVEHKSYLSLSSRLYVCNEFQIMAELSQNGCPWSNRLDDYWSNVTNCHFFQHRFFLFCCCFGVGK